MGKNIQKFMKLKFCVLFVIINSFFNLKSDDNELFSKANSLYKDGHYKDALNLYESMSLKGTRELYNIGNCYYKLEDPSKAIGYWKKALKYADFCQIDDINFNINFLYKKINKKNETSALKLLVRKYLLIIPDFILQLLILIFLYLLIFFGKNLIKIRFFFIFLIFLNLFSISIIEMKSWQNYRKI